MKEQPAEKRQRSEPRVVVEVEERGDAGKVAWIEIDHVVRHNIFTTPVMDALIERLRELGEDESIRAVVVSGAGDKAFVGGADIHEMVALEPESARDFITKVHSTCDAVRNLPVPAIARIDGYCLGAGLEFAASCDIRVASDRASFGMPEVRVGLPSVIEAALLPRLMGRGRAAEMLFTGETIGAYDALSAGLVERVAPHDKLDATVDEILNSILLSGPKAIRLQKELLRQWDELPLCESIRRSIDVFGSAYETGEPKECMERFLRRIRERKH